MRIPIRAGDINFHPAEKADGKVIKHNGTFVVGLGETTGHRHLLKVQNPDDLVIRQDAKGDYYFELLAEGELTHEEHKTLVVPKGIYKKFQEKEIDLFSNCVRRVID